MSSPLCANWSRDASRAGLGIGPVVQVENDKQVGSGVEVMCSQFKIEVEVDSVPVVVGPVVTVLGPVVALVGEEAMDVLSLVVQAVTVNVSAGDVIGSAYGVAGPLVHAWLTTGSVDEVRCSVVELVFFAILAVVSVIHEGPTGLVRLVSEVIVSAVDSIGPVVKAGPNVQVMDPVVEANDPVLELSKSTSASLWLSSTGLMGYAVSGQTSGMTGDVGSGLVAGLKGYGVSNRLPTERKRQQQTGRQQMRERQGKIRLQKKC